MATTVESICNIALGDLSVEAIASITEDSTAARACNVRYQIHKDALLADHSWNFATVRALLTAESTVPAYEWSHQFALPSDCMRIVRIEGDPKFTQEGSKILCNQGSIKIKYVSNSIAVANYPYVFIEALAARLAAALSYQLTQKTELRAAMENLYDKAIAKARHLNAINKTPEALVVDDFLIARRGDVTF